MAIAAAGALAFAVDVLPDRLAWAAPMRAAIGEFANVLLSIFIEALPFLLIGSAASGLVAGFLPVQQPARWQARTPLLGILAGSVLGLFLPAGEVGAVPLARRLLAKRVPLAAAVAVMLAAPALNLLSIASMLAAFGFGWIVAARLLLALAVALTAGLVFARFPQVDWLRPAAVLTEEEANPAAPPAGKISRAVAIALEDFYLFGALLVAGAALAAAVQVALPAAAPVSIPAALLMGFFQSGGTLADAPLAAGFAGSAPGGSLLALLAFGALLDVKNLLLYRAIFTWRAIGVMALAALAVIVPAALLCNAIGLTV